MYIAKPRVSRALGCAKEKIHEQIHEKILGEGSPPPAAAAGRVARSGDDDGRRRGDRRRGDDGGVYTIHPRRIVVVASSSSEVVVVVGSRRRALSPSRFASSSSSSSSSPSTSTPTPSPRRASTHRASRLTQTLPHYSSHSNSPPRASSSRARHRRRVSSSSASLTSGPARHHHAPCVRRALMMSTTRRDATRRSRTHARTRVMDEWNRWRRSTTFTSSSSVVHCGRATTTMLTTPRRATDRWRVARSPAILRGFLSLHATGAHRSGSPYMGT